MDWSCTRFLVSFVSRSVSVFFPSVSLYSLFAMITPSLLFVPNYSPRPERCQRRLCLSFASDYKFSIRSFPPLGSLLFTFPALFSLSHTSLLSSPLLNLPTRGTARGVCSGGGEGLYSFRFL